MSINSLCYCLYGYDVSKDDHVGLRFGKNLNKLPALNKCLGTNSRIYSKRKC